MVKIPEAVLEKARRRYFSRGMLKLAKVLYEFFEEAKENPEFSPQDTANALQTKYALSPKHAKLLNEWVVTRASRANSVMQALKREFHIDDTGKINNPQGIYVALRGGKPPKALEARIYSIAVGFVIDRWKYKGSFGGTISEGDGLYCEEDESIEDFRKYQGLAFCMADSDHLLKKGNNPAPGISLLRVLVEMDKERLRTEMSRETERHELRHVFDYILGISNCNKYLEFVAHMYAHRLEDIVSLGFDPVKGLREDMGREGKYYKGWIEGARKRISKFKKLKRKEEIQREEKRIEELEKHAQEFADEAVALAEILRTVSWTKMPLRSYALSAYALLSQYEEDFQ